MLFVFFALPRASGQFSATFEHFTMANTPVFTTNNFRCIAVGDRNTVFAGSQYGGLYKYDDSLKFWFKSSLLTNVFINDIKTDGKRGLWIAQSGTQGTSGGASSIAGGINYFPNWSDLGMVFYSVPGTTTGGGLTSRNVRSMYVDTVSVKDFKNKPPRVWAAMNTYITSGNTAPGGIVVGLNAAANFFTQKRKGLQVVPFVFQNGTPQCDAIGGDDKEVWISARTNFGNSQIIRYHSSGSENSYLGSYTPANTPELSSFFRVNAIHFDKDGRRWLGLNNGGLVVQHIGKWYKIDTEAIIPAGASVNNNAITSDEYGYVYIGTSNGLIVFNGGGQVTDPVNYIRYTTADNLLSNNITGVAYDNKNGKVLLTSPSGISFMTVKYKIDVTMQWDNSFPVKNGNPFGVAADGVSRIYLKVKKPKDSTAALKKVEVSIADYAASQETIRGTLKTANYLNLFSYSEEANTGTTRSVFREDANTVQNDGSYWFWYKAPIDFSDDSTGEFSNLPQRYDSVKVVITYTNNIKDSVIYKIRVVRPPLLMVHGLASGPSTWKDLKHNGNTLYVESQLWHHKRALVMSGRKAFMENARLLLGGDTPIDTAKDNLNTLQGNIAYLRSMGYACNQVDYLCHSMGGIMIRMAIGVTPDKFYVGASSPYVYKNYGKGYTHKIITVNTPHNSSPVADLVDEFIPVAPTTVKNLLRIGYFQYPNAQQPFDFIDPVITPGINLATPSDWSKIDHWVASPAVKNLQINDFRRGERAGVNLKQTNQRFHMIYGNGHFAQISEQNATTLREMKSTFTFLNNMLDCILSLPLPTNVETVVKGFRALGTVAGALAFWEWYCNELGFPDYLANSDLIVPLESQIARIQGYATKPYITRFEGSNAMHTQILSRNDVGQRIFNLLNIKASSPLFGDEIPANTDPNPPSIQSNNEGSSQLSKIKGLQPLSSSTNYNKTRIEITSPATNAALTTGNTVQISVVLKNITNHLYTRVYFQGIDSANATATLSPQVFNFALDSLYPGRNQVVAIAAYRNASSGVDYFIDTISVNVQNQFPLQGFRVKDKIMQVRGRELYMPEYEAMHNNKWMALPASDAIQVVVESPQIATYYTGGYRFEALQDGITPVFFQFGSFRDTALIETIMPLASFCQNTTIAAGNLSNPAIWSAGRVPISCDQLIVNHNVQVDTSLQVSAIEIKAGATLNVNNTRTLTLGQLDDDGSTNLLNRGSLIINGGHLNIRGRVKAYPGSSFSLPKGTLRINGKPEFDLP
ncbi:MAG: hypothetical protein EAY75_02990 [Bacteroidetes bacterium]|nr:MAG: hypothetical protein EAY75_02990 [Bacteroidota bacterium]